MAHLRYYFQENWQDRDEDTAIHCIECRYTDIRRGALPCQLCLQPICSVCKKAFPRITQCSEKRVCRNMIKEHSRRQVAVRESNELRSQESASSTERILFEAPVGPGGMGTDTSVFGHKTKWRIRCCDDAANFHWYVDNDTNYLQCPACERSWSIDNVLESSKRQHWMLAYDGVVLTSLH